VAVVAEDIAAVAMAVAAVLSGPASQALTSSLQAAAAAAIAVTILF
jgi:hypothetical protein